MDRLRRPKGAFAAYYVQESLQGTRVPDLRSPGGFRELPGRWDLFAPLRNNLVMVDAAVAMANLLTGHPNFRIAAMYFEFQNVAELGDTVTVPTYDDTDTLAYYASLADSEDTDYLRVPILASTVTSSSDLYPLGNICTFFAQTAGIVGVNGKSFAATVDSGGSVVYGAALVATPDFDDPTQDLIVSRYYYATDLQQAKLASSQISSSWPLQFN